MKISHEHLKQLCVLAQLDLPATEQDSFIADLERRLGNISLLPLVEQDPSDWRTPLTPSQLRSDTAGGSL